MGLTSTSISWTSERVTKQWPQWTLGASLQHLWYTQILSDTILNYLCNFRTTKKIPIVTTKFDICKKEDNVNPPNSTTRHTCIAWGIERNQSTIDWETYTVLVNSNCLKFLLSISQSTSLCYTSSYFNIKEVFNTLIFSIFLTMAP